MQLKKQSGNLSRKKKINDSFKHIARYTPVAMGKTDLNLFRCAQVHERTVLENMNEIFIVVFTFLGLMTLLALYMLVVVL